MNYSKETSHAVTFAVRGKSTVRKFDSWGEARNFAVSIKNLFNELGMKKAAKEVALSSN